MTRDEFDKLLPLKVPAVIAECPICSDVLFIDGVDEWYDEGGQMRLDPEMGVSLDCATEPDIDDPEWHDWHNGHWSMPYVDWLPVQQRVTRWLAAELVKPDCLRYLGVKSVAIAALALAPKEPDHD